MRFFQRIVLVTMLLWMGLFVFSSTLSRAVGCTIPTIDSFVRSPTDPVFVGATVTINATGSVGGPACEISFASWTWIIKPAGSTAVLQNLSSGLASLSVEFVPDVPGVYEVELQIENEVGAVSQTEVIDVEDGGGGETAAASESCSVPPQVSILGASTGTTVQPGELVLVSGVVRNPTGCSVLNLSWRLAAKPPGSSATLATTSGLNTSFTVDVPGEYQVVFGANNEKGAAFVSQSISVPGAGDGDIDLTIPDNGSGNAPGVPTISALNPSSGVPGMLIVISGANFSPVFEENLVFFGNVRARVLSASGDTLTIAVPDLPDGTYAITVTVVPTAQKLPTTAGSNKGFSPSVAPIESVHTSLLLADNEGSNIILFKVDANASPQPLTGEDVGVGFVVGDVIIFFRAGISTQEIEIVKAEFGFTSLIQYASLGYYRAHLEAASISETIEVVDRLMRDPRVDEAFFNQLVDILQFAEPQLGLQDWLLALGLPEGFESFFPKQGEGTRVAVIDTGADLMLPSDDLPELTFDPAAPLGLNFSPNPNDDSGQDELGHGTIVSTVVAASANRFNGIGVAPAANILVLKIFTVVDGQVKATNEGVSQALLQAFQLEVDVINLSLGCGGCSRDSEGALRRFYKKVIDNLIQEQQKKGAKLPIIVAASGNDGEQFLDSPAAHSAVIAVGSIKPDLSERSTFSNYGPELDFVAIGESINTTLAGGEFANGGSGTSFAAPQVAGLVALILAEKPGLDTQQIKELIKTCFSEDVGPAGFDEETGWGRIVIPEDPAQRPTECVLNG